MPTYQYACTECDHRFEAVQAFSDNALTECPECSGRLRKLYGAVGVVFKGSGFYRNDSRSSSSSSEPSSSSKGESKGESTSTPATPSTSSGSSSSSSSSSTPAAAAS
ncbi:FmdB family zinc ribbon protein [Saccharothrix longispora]|uniref:FmdB family zinc ribbon protein n=1 Tax=Saccharothrix longispora TaxID=33920 RepID=UPI0028FDBACB|nr:FmdB family zinc ribbon protein [Saccharothrix longispora]MBY8850467.1 FmdB family transcriptional regulator [Saccharothrix sp. MB29]MDU0292490.1 FmdB family zinc ribbon protein [Saccharothrix longispora]